MIFTILVSLSLIIYGSTFRTDIRNVCDLAVTRGVCHLPPICGSIANGKPRNTFFKHWRCKCGEKGYLVGPKTVDSVCDQRFLGKHIYPEKQNLEGCHCFPPSIATRPQLSEERRQYFENPSKWLSSHRNPALEASSPTHLNDYQADPDGEDLQPASSTHGMDQEERSDFVYPEHRQWYEQASHEEAVRILEDWNPGIQQKEIEQFVQDEQQLYRQSDEDIRHLRNLLTKGNNSKKVKIVAIDFPLDLVFGIQAAVSTGDSDLLLGLESQYFDDKDLKEKFLEYLTAGVQEMFKGQNGPKPELTKQEVGKFNRIKDNGQQFHHDGDDGNPNSLLVLYAASVVVMSFDSFVMPADRRTIGTWFGDNKEKGNWCPRSSEAQEARRHASSLLRSVWQVTHPNGRAIVIENDQLVHAGPQLDDETIRQRVMFRCMYKRR